MKYSNIVQILKQAPYFTKQNIALALDKEGENLNYWIKKMLDEKSLMQLKNGLYVSTYYQELTKQNPAEYEAYIEYLANIIRSPSYISLEYVLAKYGLIPEAVFSITSITIKTPRNYSSQVGNFTYRSIKKEFFYGWELQKFRNKNIKIASLSKATFDFLYLRRSKDTQLNNYLLNDARFNWNIFSNTDKAELTNLINKSSSKKMKNILKILKKAGIL